MDKNLGGMANVWDSTTPVNQLQPARQSASNRLEPVVRTAAQAQTAYARNASEYQDESDGIELDLAAEQVRRAQPNRTSRTTTVDRYGGLR